MTDIFINSTRVCYICDNKVEDSSKKLVESFTPISKISFPLIISSLISDEFVLLVRNDDTVCNNCISLVHKIDKLEHEIHSVKKILSSFLIKKYDISLKDMNFSHSVGFMTTTKGIKEIDSDTSSCDQMYALNLYDNKPSGEEKDKRGDGKQSTVSLQCSVCLVNFKQKEVLKMHLKTCGEGIDSSENFICKQEMDSSLIIDYDECRDETVTVENEKITLNQFGNDSDEIIDEITLQPDTSYICDLCSDEFYSADDFNSHMIQHSLKDCVTEQHSSSEIIGVSDILDNQPDVNTNESYLQCGNESSMLLGSDSFVTEEVILEKNKKLVLSKKQLNSGQPGKTLLPLYNQFSNLSCHICSIKSSSKSELANHLKEHYDVDSSNFVNSRSNFVCRLCGAKCGNRVDYVSHYEDHLKVKQIEIVPVQKPLIRAIFGCEICGEKYNSTNEFTEHFKIHNINKCKDCGKEFSSDLKLKEHSVTHKAEVKPNQCEYCLVRFDVREDLEGHVEDVHRDLKGLRNCPLCNKRCASGFAVKRHVLKAHLIPVLQQEIRENYALGCDLMDNMKSVGASEQFMKNISSVTPETKPPLNILENNNCPIFLCDICGFTTKEKSEILKHNNVHNVESVLCSICSKLFGGDDELKLHMSTEHNICLDNSQCPHCLEEFTTDLIDHIKNKHGKMYTTLLCYICGEMFFNKSKLTNHVKNTHLVQSSTSKLYVGGDDLSGCVDEVNEVVLEEDADSELSKALKTIESPEENTDIKVKYKCGICNTFLSADRAEIETHMLEHENICDICKKECSSEQDLSKHVDKHSSHFQNLDCIFCSDKLHDTLHLQQHMNSRHADKGQPYCEPCDKYFSQRAVYLRHISSKHSINKSCNVCGEHFTNLNNFIFHRDYTHRTDMKCTYCKKVCRDPKQLKNHEGIHKKYKGQMFNCSECDKVFKTPSGLKFHTISHTGKYPYVCEFCGRGFISLYSLSEHRAGHTGDVRYCCEICGKSFRLYDTYHRHRRLHDDPFPSECGDCGKRFRNASRVAEHRRKAHTGERPYACPHCPMTFNVSSSYRLHLCIHTKMFPYNCQVCSRGFTTRLKYGNHLASKHEDYSIVNKKKTGFKDFSS